MPRSALVLALLAVVTSVGVKSSLARFERERSTVARRLPATIEVSDPSGGAIDVTAMVASHRVTVLSFWASWCAPCRVELPQLDSLARSREADVTFVAVSVDADRSAFEDYVRAHPLQVETGHDAGGVLFSELGLSGLPTTVLVGADGAVIAVVEGGDVVAVEEALADTARAGGG